MAIPDSKNSKWQGLGARIGTALVLAILVAGFLSYGGVLFNALVILAALLMMKEWDALTTSQPVAIYLAGYPLIILPTASILWMREIPGSGFSLVLLFIAVITATDTTAYFVGRRWGVTPLAPTISPKKTWEGLAGGVCGAFIVGLLGSHFVALPHSIWSAWIISIVIALLAQAGDLLKSWIKRRAGVKDSGSILPGHGGVLDRLDGYLLTSPLLALLVYIVL